MHLHDSVTAMAGARLVGDTGSWMTVVSLPGRRAGLEGVEKGSQLLNSTDATQRDTGMLLFLHPRPASSHAGRAGDWSSFSSPWSPSPIEDAWLSGDCPGQGLSALAASRLEHRAHLAPTAESLKAAEALHDLPIAALFQARSCREGDRQVATGAAEDPVHRPERGLLRPIDEAPPGAEG
jgi:hypothetical protein